MLKRLIFKLLDLYRRIRLWWLSSRGLTESDIHAQRIASGRAWEEFCDSLKAAGGAMVYGGAPQDPFNQAEGYRYLSRLARAGLEAFVEYADPKFPVLRRMVHETVKLGADNPDNFYMNCKIDGQYEYRIFGNRKTAHYLGFATQRGDYGKEGGMQLSGALEASDLKVQSDGSFEIILSTKQKGKNWLPTAADSSLLIVRQTFLDKETEELADIHIECLGGNDRPDPLTPELVDKGLSSASAFVAGAAMFFARWSKGFKAHPNQLPLFDPATSTAAGGDENIAYYHSYWQLGQDEALLIDFNPPDCPYWNFQLNNYWMESLDYRYHQVTLNKHSARTHTDGTVRLVVAHQDPGLPNWIDTAHHEQGTMCLRWVKAQDWPTPSTQVVSFNSLH
ncbi:MAG: DUF1214 domain-containing protein [Bacteroidota bacterium]